MDDFDNDAVAEWVTTIDDLDQVISLGLWHWPADTRTLRWSKQIYEIFGVEKDSFTPGAAQILALIHPDDRNNAITTLKTANAQQESCELEVRIIRPDGEYRACSVRIQPLIKNKGFVALRGMCLDVTQLRQAQAKAREMEDYRHIIELSPHNAWTGDSEGNILSLGKNWADITGQPTDDALGSGWMSAVHPDDLNSSDFMPEPTLEGQTSLDSRYRLRAAGGNYRWVRTRAYPLRDDTGEIIRWYGLTEDIDEQVEAEQRLRESEEHHRYTVELSPQVPWTADAQGNITEVGPRWFELVGMDREATLGQGWASALHPDDVAHTFNVWTDCLHTGEAVDLRYRLKQVDGEYRWCRARARPRHDETGQIIRWYGVVEDIDKQVRAEDALSRAEERYRLATQATNDLIWDLDVATNRVEWTRSLVDSFGYRTTELGTDESWWRERIHPDDRAARVGGFQAAVGGDEQQFVSEYRFRRADGTYATVCDRAHIVRDDEGKAVRAVGAMQDLSARKNAEEKARWGAVHDYLTELPNRRLFHERLHEALDNAAAADSKVALLQLDVDHFKQVNDALGHGAGDALLRTLATRLREAIRPGDTIARLGGDEFALILPDVGEADEVADRVQALLERMREPFAYESRVLDCRASVGVSIHPEHGTTPEELLKNADIALYMAKSMNRGGLVVYEHRMREEMRKRTSMVTRAREAIREDRLEAFYQPKVDLHQNNRIVGFEALLRWRDPVRGIQLPMTLEAAFDDLEVAAEISDRMVEHTIRDMRQWLDDGVEFGHVAVNAAAAEFRRNDFAERVLEALAKAKVPTSHFHLEVTETVFLGRGAEYVDRALRMLSDEGVKIALDDFGTGYASLRHLKQFPVDIIKIDQSFVRGMVQNPDDEAIIRAVVGLGQSLGISVVAEGIETQAQHDELRKIGCNFGQGFLYSRAVFSAKVPQLLARADRQSGALSDVA